MAHREGSVSVPSLLFLHHPPLASLFPGFLSLLQYKQSIDGSGSLIHKSARKSQVMEQHGVSIKVVSLRADTTVPRSIVRVHSAHMKEDTPEKLNIQARRVTWAL